MANFLTGGYLSGKKTYVTAVTGIVGAIGLYLTGDADLVSTFQTVITAASAAFIRAGVAKAGK